MTYRYKNYNIIIEKDVLSLFDSYKQTGRKHEKGGILLGQVSENEVRINRASIPTIFDSSTRFSFTRHKKSAQLITDYEFHNSNGKIIYLGEWHTHPENVPTPSSTDNKMIVKQYSKNKINETFLLMIIVGLKGLFVAIYDGVLTELKPLNI